VRRRRRRAPPPRRSSSRARRHARGRRRGGGGLRRPRRRRGRIRPAYPAPLPAREAAAGSPPQGSPDAAPAAPSPGSRRALGAGSRARPPRPQRLDPRRRARAAADSLATMAIIPVQMRLVYRVGQAYGYELDRGHVRDLLATLGVGLTSQYLRTGAGASWRACWARSAGACSAAWAARSPGPRSPSPRPTRWQVARRYYGNGPVLDTAQLKEGLLLHARRGQGPAVRYAGQIEQRAAAWTRRSSPPWCARSRVRGRAKGERANVPRGRFGAARPLRRRARARLVGGSLLNLVASLSRACGCRPGPTRGARGGTHGRSPASGRASCWWWTGARRELPARARAGHAARPQALREPDLRFDPAPPATAVTLAALRLGARAQHALDGWHVWFESSAHRGALPLRARGPRSPTRPRTTRTRWRRGCSTTAPLFRRRRGERCTRSRRAHRRVGLQPLARAGRDPPRVRRPRRALRGAPAA